MKLTYQEGLYRNADPRVEGRATFTAFVAFPDGALEEIDVQSGTPAGARRVAEAAVEHDFMEGGQVIHIVERFGLYL